MSLIKWDPFREFNTLPARLAFWGKDWEEPLSTTTYVPSVDIFETDNEVVVKAEMPGMTKDDIQVSLSDNILTIKGEKKKEEEKSDKDYYRSERVYGAFMRSLPLPAEVNPEKIHAAFKNGVLEVRLPKTEEAKKKAINVKVQG